jgi:hypothetical protein
MSWIALIPDLIALILAVVKHFEAARLKGEGRAEAVSEALVIAAEELRVATKAVYEAEEQHAANPDSDDAFDKDFERK